MSVRISMCVALVMVCVLLPLFAFAQGDDALTTAAKQVTDRFVQSAQAKRGEVAEIDGPTLYVSLGSGDGILEGQLLQIAAKGDPIVVNGETLGYKEKPVGVAEVTTVQGERLCLATVQRLTEGQQPAKGNLAYLKPAPPTLAISSFLRQDNAPTAMGQEFADKLGMALQATGKFRMVERSRLETALGELKLGLNDLFDPTKAARLGQMIQAKGVVTGTITQQNDRYTINVRVVDIETGTQVLTAVATCGRSDELDRKYGLAGPGGGGGTTLPVKLFDACKPFQRNDFEKRIMGTCPVGGKLYDDCVGYTRGFVIFDLKSGQWDELRFSLGWHDTEGWRCDLAVTVDGNRVFERRPDRDKPLEKDVRIPLKGIRMLRLDAGQSYADNGILIPGDFILVPAGGGTGPG